MRARDHSPRAASTSFCGTPSSRFGKLLLVELRHVERWVLARLESFRHGAPEPSENVEAPWARQAQANRRASNDPRTTRLNDPHASTDHLLDERDRFDAAESSTLDERTPTEARRVTCARRAQASGSHPPKSVTCSPKLRADRVVKSHAHRALRPDANSHAVVSRGPFFDFQTNYSIRGNPVMVTPPSASK